MRNDRIAAAGRAPPAVVLFRLRRLAEPASDRETVTVTRRRSGADQSVTSAPIHPSHPRRRAMTTLWWR